MPDRNININLIYQFISSCGNTSVDQRGSNCSSTQWNISLSKLKTSMKTQPRRASEFRGPSVIRRNPVEPCNWFYETKIRDRYHFVEFRPSLDWTYCCVGKIRQPTTCVYYGVGQSASVTNSFEFVDTTVFHSVVIRLIPMPFAAYRVQFRKFVWDCCIMQSVPSFRSVQFSYVCKSTNKGQLV